MYKVKPHFFVIPGLTIVVGWLGSLCVRAGMRWYEHLSLPSYVPAPWMISLAWNSIFILTAYVVIRVWESRWAKRQLILWLFIPNAFLNVLWSYLFFYKNCIGYGLLDAIVLLISVIVLIYYIALYSLFLSYLLIPYLLWMIFAIILNTHIWLLN